MDPNSTPLPSLNESDPTRIPARRRRLLIVLAIAAAAGLVAAAAVVVTSRGGGQAQARADACRPFSGPVPLSLDLPGRPTLPHRNAAVLAAAERLLPPGDVRVAVARAVAGFPRASADATLAQLRSLGSQPVVRLYEGLVELWAGRCQAAQAALTQVRASDMWGFYGTIADNTLHPGQRSGYPLYLPPPGTPTGSVQHLAALVRRHPGQAGPWLGLAYADQVRDRRAALAAARRAEAVAGGVAQPRVAAAVLGYDKNDPAASIGALGTLLQQAPADQLEIRFHLGLLLYWFGDRTDAAAQWRQVAADSPSTIYGRLSTGLLAKIS